MQNNEEDDSELTNNSSNDSERTEEDDPDLTTVRGESIVQYSAARHTFASITPREEHHKIMHVL